MRGNDVKNVSICPHNQAKPENKTKQAKLNGYLDFCRAVCYLRSRCLVEFYHYRSLPISLRNLRILTAIALKGSFAAAADHLGLTQSAISLQIKNLEDELGVQLFERNGRSPKLNTSGRLVLERAKEILTIYDGIRDELTPSGMIRGTLTLGVVPTVLTGPLPPVLGRLRRRYEDLHVKLLSGLSAELVRQVEEGNLDAALTTEPPFTVPPLYEWQEYDVEPFFVVAPKQTEATSVELLFEHYPFVRFDK